MLDYYSNITELDSICLSRILKYRFRTALIRIDITNTQVAGKTKLCEVFDIQGQKIQNSEFHSQLENLRQSLQVIYCLNPNINFLSN
jgi:hypothetical protein